MGKNASMARGRRDARNNAAHALLVALKGLRPMGVSRATRVRFWHTPHGLLCLQSTCYDADLIINNERKMGCFFLV